MEDKEKLTAYEVLSLIAQIVAAIAAIIAALK